ncbi:MAG: hypothetical protein DRJ42_12985 [Deltaproteobacteria bacterium]|nr:MAG: hypothetical protein DRJ42_12985 [Deltaproteobacteria bacterium]
MTCRDFMGTEIAEAACPAPKPSTNESCASVAYVGSGCPTTSQIGVLDNGDCADRPTCTDCPTLTANECRDYCLSQAISRGRRVTCDLSGCTTECNVYDGHGFDGGCSDNHSTWYAFPP